jgi:site-specific recombinase XerD
MAVTQSKRNIPTVAEAVERFISKHRGQRGVREHISVLHGPRSGRVVGKRAAGTALARSPLGPLRFDRVSGDDFAGWFYDRHPQHLAASTLKRGRSSLRQLLLFAIESGWADEYVLAALPPVSSSPPRRQWLRPAQLVVLDALMTEEHFNEAQRFMWRCLANTGLRTEELVRLKPQALNVIDGTLKVRGKGRGDGKDRDVPVSAEFRAEWQAFVLENRLRPTSWLFPQTAVRFVPGERCATQRVTTNASRHCTPKAARTVFLKLQDLVDDAVRDGRIPSELRPEFALTPQVLRRTYACCNLIASEMLGAGHGLDLRSLQEAMGHASLETTAMYLSDVASYLNRMRRPVSLVETAELLIAA